MLRSTASGSFESLVTCSGDHRQADGNSFDSFYIKICGRQIKSGTHDAPDTGFPFYWDPKSLKRRNITIDGALGNFQILSDLLRGTRPVRVTEYLDYFKHPYRATHDPFLKEIVLSVQL